MTGSAGGNLLPECFTFYPTTSENLSMPLWMQITGIAVAGSAAAVARFGLGHWVTTLTSESGFPWGTVVVNILGCLLFGLVVGLLHEGHSLHHWRPILLTGFLGAFTTFSTFVFETQKLINDSQYVAAFGNLALQNLIGLAAVIAGLAIGQRLVSP